MLRKSLVYFTLSLTPMIIVNGAETTTQNSKVQTAQNKQIKAFTGKIIGSNVRLRTLPDLESFVVSELTKNQLLVIDGERNDFYAIKPLPGMKAYVFRSFILDNVVEGNRVNVRLFPDLEAPIVGHLSSGQHLNGEICEKNHKWLEISLPEDTRFYVAKEYVEYVGGPELKAAHDKRKSTVTQLLDSAALITQAEFRKSFEEINLDRLTRNYQTVINDYADFPAEALKAKTELANVKESFIQRKLTYLEAKASKMSQGGNWNSSDESPSIEKSSNCLSMTDRMKIWEPIESALFRSWAAMHHSKTMEDYYGEQKLHASVLTGLLENYSDPVKNKPGDFLVRNYQDIPVGYVYSTHLDLEQYVGKQVRFLVIDRPNNNFAFPAYYVIGAE